MLVGYARISTTDQNLDLQKDALLAAECELIFTDTANSKFVRGKGKARDEIEQNVLSRFGMEKPDKKGWEHILSI